MSNKNEIDLTTIEWIVGYPFYQTKEDLIKSIEIYTVQASGSQSDFISNRATTLAQIGITELQRRTWDKISRYSLFVAILSLITSITSLCIAFK